MAFGPKPMGTWSGNPASTSGAAHDFLQAGERYKVVKAFADHDGHDHPVGETWRFLGHSFSPYEDGMSFFVSLDGSQEWQIPLLWRTGEQGHVLDNLSQYIEAF